MMNTMYAKVGDLDIFCTSVGEGPPCLVPTLAGSPIYERTFTGLPLQLIHVELRGNRTAADDADTLTFDRVVDDLDGVRRALGLDRVAVLGHSAHAFVAFAYAARYPTTHVLAIGGAPGKTAAVAARTMTYWDLIATPERKRIVEANRAALTPARMAALSPSEQVIVPYAANGPMFFYDPTYDCTPLWAGHDRISPAVFMRFWGPNSQFDAFDPAELGKITAPMFIGQGVFDFAAPPYVWDGQRPANATYRVFEKSGHYPQLDEPEAFRDAIARWL